MDRARWVELGRVANTDRIETHPRLLRSLSFGDDDYVDCIHEVVPAVLGEEPEPAPDPDPDPQSFPNAPQPAALTPHERFPKLIVVSDFVSLPAWLAANETNLFNRLFVIGADAAMPDGTILSAAEATAARLEVAEMRRQIERIRRDHASDPEAAIGQAKELVETVCKTILGFGGADDGAVWKFPQLVKKALLHLGIDPSLQEGTDAVQVRAAREMVGGVSKILNGADELRNARGTGHGRSKSPLVDDAIAQLAVGAALAAAVYLAQVYEAQATGEPATLVEADPTPRPGPGSVKAGSFVCHDTFGEGMVIEVSGAAPNEAAVVEFAGAIGRRTLLLRYAELRLVSH